MTHQIRTEPHAGYGAEQSAEDAIIDQELEIIARRMFSREGDALTSPRLSKQYVALQIMQSESEVFCCMFLDSQHRVIKFEKMFYGTIDSASVYPREIAKRALELNAGAVILAHNHPSGITTPSDADKGITNKIKDTLGLFDIRVLDHIIVGEVPVAFSEMGLM